MKLLLIEDETVLADALSRQLSRAGFSVQWAQDAATGDWLWQNELFDLVLLDLGLPGESGLTLLQRRRAQGDVTPVLILTARNAWHERVEGLQAGADDYLGKPFHFEELKARIQALLRRSSGAADNRLVCGNLVLDLDSRQLHVDGEAVTLTGAEFRLLVRLMRHPGKVFSKQQLLEAMTEDPYDKDPNMVEVYVRRLRQRVGRHRIETLRGQGYRWVCEDA